MHILVVTQYFWPESFRINDLCAALRERGHCVEILTGLPNYPQGKIFSGFRWRGPWTQEWEGMRIWRSPLIPRGTGTSLRLVLNYLSFAAFASCRSLRLIFRPYDVIFFFGTSPVVAAVPALVFGWLRRLPVVHWVQDLWPESAFATGHVKSRLVLGVLGFFSKWIYRGSALVLTQSEGFKVSMRKFGLSESALRYFPNSVEKLFETLPTHVGSSVRGHFPAGFCIVFAGNIGVAQDFTTILAAFQTLKEEGYEGRIHLLVLGEGSQRQAIESQVRDLQLQAMIRFLGRFPTEQMPDFFTVADALLVTLKREPIFALTIPSKIQSYMACARPILAALDGEGKRVVEEAGCGLTCDAENAGELAKNIIRLEAMSTIERGLLGRKGLEYFKGNFERAMLISRLEQLLLEAKRGA